MDGNFRWLLDHGKVVSRSEDSRALRMMGTDFDISGCRFAEERNRIQHDLMQALAATHQIEDGLRLCLEAALKAGGMTWGGLYLLDPKSCRLNLRVHAELSSEVAAAAARVEAGSAQYRLVAEGAPVYFEFEELRLTPSAVELREGLHCVAILPILNEGKLLGCLSAGSPRHDTIPQSARLALETIAASAGQAIARLNAQEALREGERGFRAFFQTLEDERLQEREADLARAQRMAHLGSWKWNIVDDVVTWSEELFWIFGVDPKTFVPSNAAAAALLHPQDRAAHAELVAKALTGEAVGSFECRLVRPSGEERFVLASGFDVEFDGHGKPVQLFGTVLDTTDRRQAEEALRKSESLLRQMGQVAKVGGWEFDVATGEGTWTEEVARIHDLPPGTPSNKALGLSFYQGESRRRIEAAIEQAVAQAAPYDLELELVSAKGVRKWVHTIGQPVVESGRVVRLRGAFPDITEPKRLEAQLRQAQKLEAVGQLAGGIAHDFNNILAAVMMHLGLLQMNPALDADTLESLKELNAEARRAAALTRQLLMFSRRSVLAIRPQDLNDVVANLLKMLSRLIGENINLNFEAGSRLPSVEADAGMLEQVLMNLVVNARDAMPRGGRISIRTMAAELGAAEAALNPERRAGRFVCLAVSDTGAGMDEATIKRIFEPFFTTKEAGKGTGLGLATVHGIVAQHRGWVEVESAVGRGTTFSVLLPALAQTVAAVEAPSSAPLQRGRETILLVEDEASVRQSVGQTLRVLGYRVHEAANGQEAMRLWQRHGPEVDLLLTDMVMPEGMTGLELTEQLQASKPGLKAIISSGYSAEIAHAGVPRKAGLVYLPKPYEITTLAAAIRGCLESGP